MVASASSFICSARRGIVPSSSLAFVRHSSINAGLSSVSYVPCACLACALKSTEEGEGVGYRSYKPREESQKTLREIFLRAISGPASSRWLLFPLFISFLFFRQAQKNNARALKTKHK
jgi:hypothetical protein